MATTQAGTRIALTPPRMPVARGRVFQRAGTVAAVAVVTAVGALLRLWSFDRVGGNPFYDAAVRSMALSWHNLFFGAFEPGAQVSVDKTPADLWLQVAAVKALGFSGVAVRIPEAVAGIAAIPLLYDLVRRCFGRTAGLGAAAAFALLPTAILTAHSDTMDSLMMLLDLLAAWLLVVGAQRRSAWPVVAAGAVVGLAFNVKLFEALIVLPALVVLAVLLPGGRRVRGRLSGLAGGAAAMVGVGLGWIAIASLTPLAHRPWPIGSTNGGIWNVVFRYNGLDRIASPASAAALRLDPPGPLRFLSAGGHAYLVTVGTMLIAALALGGAAFVAGAVGGARRWRHMPTVRSAGAAFFATWLISGIALLSHMSRMQPRYLEAVTPAIAAAVGIGAGALAADRRRLPRTGYACVVTAVAVAGILLVRPSAWAIGLALGGAAGCWIWVRRGARPGVIAAFALAAVLALPAWGAVAVARDHRSDAGLPSRIPPRDVVLLSAFLLHHQGGAHFEFASPSVMRAAPVIVHDARPVLMLTSSGGRPLVGAAALAHEVASGQVRYGLLGPGACGTATASGRPCAGAVRWALAHAVDVSADAGLPRGMVYRLQTTPVRARP